MKRVLRSTGVLALLASLAAASIAATPAAGRAVELTRVKIGIFPIDGAGQVMYAKHRGMFRKQGIDAELKILADPSQIVAALVSGDVQFSLASVSSTALLKSKGAPVKVVAAAVTFDPKEPVSALIAGEGKRITRARDLVGKTIAVEGQSTPGHLGVVEWLERNGVDGDDVTFTYLGFPLMLGPLAQGTIDAAYVVEPILTLALQAGAKRIGIPFRAVCSKICQVTFWIARADVDENLEARFRNAVQKAAVWANQRKHDQASGKILAKYVPLDAKVFAEMTRSTFGTRLRVSLAKPWLDLFAKHGLIPASFKPGDLVK
jgi:NitT/TauT family transport system substrate-binding protein